MTGAVTRLRERFCGQPYLINGATWATFLQTRLGDATDNVSHALGEMR